MLNFESGYQALLCSGLSTRDNFNNCQHYIVFTLSLVKDKLRISKKYKLALSQLWGLMAALPVLPALSSSFPSKAKRCESLRGAGFCQSVEIRGGSSGRCLAA